MDFSTSYIQYHLMEEDKSGEENEICKSNTLVDCLSVLIRSGFNSQFTVSGSYIKSAASNKLYRPDEIKSVRFHRFESEKGSSDSTMLFVLETISGEKGTSVEMNGNNPDTPVIRFFRIVNKSIDNDFGD